VNRRFVLLALLLLASGCALQPPVSPSQPTANSPAADDAIALFSANPAGGLPHGWEPLVLLRTKKSTQYRLVRKDNTTVLHAQADQSSSGLMQRVSVDPFAQPWVHWNWKAADLIKTADNTQRVTEDSPVRIILGFDGDKDTLPFADQVLFDTAKLLAGQEFPYATLMYIWENNLPVGTVIRSSHSSRIRMIVAERGADGIGQWRSFARNIVDDFERAFGEKPGKLIGVGVLTDTDNTGERVEAWYGDIRITRDRSALIAFDDAQTLLLPARQGK
jgi:hypothetical protein